MGLGYYVICWGGGGGGGGEKIGNPLPFLLNFLFLFA